MKVVKKMNSFSNFSGNTVFKGKSKMGYPITSSMIIEVKKPELGDIYPSKVIGEVSLDLSDVGGKSKIKARIIKRGMGRFEGTRCGVPTNNKINT